MDKLFYKIKRSADKPATTWIGATGCKRVFDPGQDEFIVNDVELGICLHNGNFVLVGPAPKNEIPPQPVPVVEKTKEKKEESDSKE